MKRSICLWAFMFCISSYAFCGNPDREFERAIINGAKMSMVIRVTDDDGMPVDKAKVHVLLGMNFREKANFIDGFTSANGEFQIEGETTGDEVEISVSKDGYYRSKVCLCLITRPGVNKVKDGKWQPWGEVRSVVLRKIDNPIQLRHHCRFVDVPQTNVWVGLDLERGDWVAPFGKGAVSDVELTVQWDGLPKESSRDCSMQVRIQGEFCGGTFVDKVLESEYPNSKSALTNYVYAVRSFDWKEREKGTRLLKQSFWNQRALVVRLRCIVDEFGQIIEAKYGCVRMLEVTPSSHNHPTLAIACVFNPTPNDTNLENVEVAQRTYKQIELEKRLEKERREKEAKTVWGGIKKMFGAP